jgi:drug/metabolite transporter (DMT)-like permease
VVPLVQSGPEFSRLIFLPPAMMDMMATSLMYVGLNLTFASSFQMLRGAVIVFTGLLSVAFLNRKLEAVKWVGIALIITGLAVVGASDIIFKGTGETHGTNNIITGNHLCINKLSFRCVYK